VEAELLAVDVRVQVSHLQYTFMQKETAHDQANLSWHSNYILHKYATPTESKKKFIPQQHVE
jgi:hypothetical protein